MTEPNDAPTKARDGYSIRIVVRICLGGAALLVGILGGVRICFALEGWPRHQLREGASVETVTALGVAIVLLVIYVVVTVQPHGRPLEFENADMAGDGTDAETDAIVGKITSLHDLIRQDPRRPNVFDLVPPPLPSATAEQRAAAFYKDLVLAPSRVITRVSEFVEPHRASHIVRSTFTLVIPEDFEGRLIVPVFRSPRGRIVTGLRLVGPGDERLSSLTQEDALSHAFSIFRSMLADTPEALRTYVETLERDLVEIVLEHTWRDDPADNREFRRLMGKLPKLPGVSADLARDLELFLIQHLAYNFICVAVDVTPKPASLIPRTVRLTVERAEPKSTGFRDPGDKDVSAISKLVVVTLPRLRQMFGVETTIYQHSLEFANLTPSYHLEVAGPRGTYLAKQALQPPKQVVWSPNDDTKVALAPRTGQRYSHVYIRNSGEDFRNILIANTFYERPPGAVMLAALSAAAAWVIVLLCALKALFRPDAMEPHADLVAVLLAFPPGIALWAGFGDGARQTMSAYLSRAVTILSSAGAAFLYVLLPPHVDSAPWWGLVMSVLTITMVGTGISLCTRVITNGRVRKSYR